MRLIYVLFVCDYCYDHFTVCSITTAQNSIAKCPAQPPSTPPTRQKHWPVPVERHSSGQDSNS